MITIRLFGERPPPATAGQRTSKAGLLDPPVTVLPPVHKNHRYPITVGFDQIGASIDIDLLPAGTRIASHPSHRDPCVVAEMTTGPGQQGDPDASRPTTHPGARPRPAQTRTVTPIILARPARVDLSSGTTQTQKHFPKTHETTTSSSHHARPVPDRWLDSAVQGPWTIIAGGARKP